MAAMSSVGQHWLRMASTRAPLICEVASCSAIGSFGQRRRMHAGWVGLGAMGYPLAGHVNRAASAQSSGSQLRVWNRNNDRAVKHSIEFGSRAVTGMEDLVGCKVVFSCLPTTAEVRILTTQFRAARQAAGVAARCIWVDCSSGDPEDTRALALELEADGVHLVDCPVSGGPRGAAAGTVTAMVGGKSEDTEAALPLIRAFAGKVQACGPVGAGMAVKAVNNLLNATHLLIGTEALLALKRAGIDPATALSVINKSSGRSLQTEVRLPEEVLTRRFGYGFKLGLMRKDCDAASQMLSDRSQNGASLLSQASQMIRKAHDARGTDVDYTELSRWMEDGANMTLAAEESSDDDQRLQDAKTEVATQNTATLEKSSFEDHGARCCILLGAIRRRT